MADPLAELTDRMVPERTNFFDPAETQTLMSRYANARRGRESTEELARSADRLSRGRFDREQEERQRLTWGREDEEYAQQKEAMAKQGEFLSALNSIDPEAEDYDNQVTGFMTSLPPALQDDPAVRSIVTFKNQVADDARRRRDAEVAKQQSFENQRALIQERSKYDAALRGLTEEDYKQATMPDGSLDLVTLGKKAAQREREGKASEFDRREKLRMDNRLKLVEVKDLSRRGRERRGNVEKWVVEDREAFPRRLDALAAKAGKPLDLVADDPKFAEEFRQAKEWDKNPLASEISAAYAYETPEAYVEVVPNLTESQKERRRKVWEHAHNDDAIDVVDIYRRDEAPVESNVPPVGHRQGGYIFLGGNPADKANWRKE